MRRAMAIAPGALKNGCHRSRSSLDRALARLGDAGRARATRLSWAWRCWGALRLGRALHGEFQFHFDAHLATAAGVAGARPGWSGGGRLLESRSASPGDRCGTWWLPRRGWFDEML